MYLKCLNKIKLCLYDEIYQFNVVTLRFSLNLMYGDSKDHDVALHFNPRRDDDCVVYNRYDMVNFGQDQNYWYVVVVIFAVI